MNTKTPKLSSCKWCNKTLNSTNPNNELCDECAKYPNEETMRKATSQRPQ